MAPGGFAFKLLFASLVVGALGAAAAKGVAPIAAAFVGPPPAAEPKLTPVITPTAEAAIPPAVASPKAANKPVTIPDKPVTVADKPVTVGAAARRPARHAARFSSLMKRLTTTRTHAVKTPVAAPPRTPMPPPGFAETGPYQRLVYGGPPPGPFGGWGYRDRYFYYP